MGNKSAIFMAVVIVGAIALDVLANDSAALTFLGRKFLELIEYVAFWR